MPSRLTNERAVAIAKAYTSNGYNKTNALKAVTKEDGSQYYAKSYCYARGHILFNNDRVKAEIKRIQALEDVRADYDKNEAMRRLDGIASALTDAVATGNISACLALLGVVKEQNEINGLRKQIHIDETEQTAEPLTQAEIQELRQLTELRRQANVKLSDAG